MVIILFFSQNKTFCVKITYYSHFCVLYFHLCKTIFFYFLLFSIHNNIYPKHYQSYKNKDWYCFLIQAAIVKKILFFTLKIRLFVWNKGFYALSSDAILNMIKIKIELISDADMYIFFEKGMRGGVSYIFNRYSQANNKYLKSYDPKANNLYGYAMPKFLLASGFKWIDPKRFYLNKYTINSSKGCVLEVDLEYPK